MKTYTFHVQGMHCHACILLTESELEEVSYVTKAKSSLSNHTVEILGEFGDKSQDMIAEELSQVLIKHGYSLSVEREEKIKNWSDFKIAIPIALGFAVLFVVLQKIGLVNLVGTNSVSYGTAFVIGINLLDTFHWAKKFQPSMPKFIAKYAHGVSKLNHALTPFLVGIATFFLPCGFTQSMHLYTLTTGSFIKGGLTMLAFALGTLPILALISFSSFSIKNSSKAGIFFKTAGLVVIMFAIFNILNSLVIVGVIPPIFNF